MPTAPTNIPTSVQTEARTQPSTQDEPALRGRRRVLERRFVAVYLALLALLLLALVPPLVNVNRFKHRIVTSISTTLGRPVHLDRVSLNVLPFPGFTLENFVVAEDPAFGSEPIIRANTVRVRLRIASLWRRKIEFSTISLDEPSLNLVHNAQGRWNFESILHQTSQITAAPTGQLRAGREPRFPYIEATGARINVKSGIEKLPFALTEADLALWLTGPQQWNLRLRGRPSRTDTNASDTGTLSIEGTLGRAATFAETPLDLTMLWQHVPLGEASMVLLGRDIGVRGELIASLEAHGTAENAAVKSRIQVNGVRRASFVPAHAVDVDMECQAEAAKLFHAFRAIRCSWPPPETATSGLGFDVRSVAGDLGSNLAGAKTRQVLALTGEIDDVYDPASASFELGAPQLPAETLLDWLRVVSSRVPATEQATGIVTMKLLRQGAATSLAAGHHTAATPSWSGDLELRGGSLTPADAGSGAAARAPIAMGNLDLRSTRPADGSFVLAPTTLTLGGREPAVLDGRLDQSGYTLHLAGMVSRDRLAELGRAIPQFGDGMDQMLPALPKTDQPARLDVSIARSWGGAQHWTGTAAAKPVTKRRHSGGR